MNAFLLKQNRIFYRENRTFYGENRIFYGEKLIFYGEKLIFYGKNRIFYGKNRIFYGKNRIFSMIIGVERLGNFELERVTIKRDNLQLRNFYSLDIGFTSERKKLKNETFHYPCAWPRARVAISRAHRVARSDARIQ